MKKIYETLLSRGYIYQSTHKEKTASLLDSGRQITFYMGIDPTANSLHIGHFFALMMFRYLQDAGHKGILVIGGATAMVGDPSGKSDIRKMLSPEEVEHNLREVETLAKRFVQSSGDNPAIIRNNADWMNGCSYINFLRDIGTHFNINTMLNSENYARRLESGGLTFLEMGYMLMQAYDFVYLQDHYGCELQIGGSDQWANIVAGVSLHRKLERKRNSELIYGLTCPLLTTKEGKKMGKTETGTLWVARDKTSVFDFYQYFYNLRDEDVPQLLNLFTRIPLEEIKRLVSRDIREAKQTMAREITALVHGQEETDRVLKSINSLFYEKRDAEDAPAFQVPAKSLADGVFLVDLLTESGFIESKSEARRLIKQGGISIDGNRIPDCEARLITGDFSGDHVIIKKGKKKFLRLEIRS